MRTGRALPAIDRRSFLKLALALPASASLAPFRALAEPARNQVKITDIKALLLRNQWKTLVKVETDAGIVGYGESGATGEMFRSRLDRITPLLIGRDPLAIERHFYAMSTITHHFMAHIPTVSGIDIALWDIAGKILGKPVSTLLGGPFRDRVRLYRDTQPKDMLDRASCRDWAQEMKQDPRGWSTYKLGFIPVLSNQEKLGAYMETLTPADLRRIRKAYENVREAVGPDIDVVVHCHSEFDLPSAIGIARAVEPIEPKWLEDVLPHHYSESWVTLKRSTRVPILIGEKLELAAQFLPFLQNQAADIVHPDVCFSGGLTGVRKIADLASLYRVPLALHNIGGLPLMMASVHLAASIHDFIASENAIGQGRFTEVMGATKFPEVRDSCLPVPQTPGLGADLDPKFLKENMAPGEPWWG
jgi:L-alanine-DL-glutamate epimerase-like enolase superfamily enzyme